MANTDAEKVINKAQTAIFRIFKKRTLNWDAFERLVKSVKDINAYNPDFNETILSDALMYCSGDNGELAPKVVKLFLDNGYDVSANNGLNGGAALIALCYSSYDKYILEAAKILINAGAPIVFESEEDDDPECEPNGVLRRISIKKDAAWVIGNNYDSAVLFETYYAIAKAKLDGKDFNQIYSHVDCIGKPLEAVYTTKGALCAKDDIYVYTSPLIMQFGNKPLVVRCYVDFFINPIYVEETQSHLVDVSEVFKSIIGATLKTVKYIDQSTCFFDFSNGQRLVFSIYSVADDGRAGAFEIRKSEDDVNLKSLKIDSLCSSSGHRYASTVTTFGEHSLVLFGENEAYLMYPFEYARNKCSLKLCTCSKNLVKEYTRQYPISSFEQAACYYRRNNLCAVRIKANDNYLYIMPNEFCEIEVQLSNTLYYPLKQNFLPRNAGKCIDFLKKQN